MAKAKRWNVLYLEEVGQCLMLEDKVLEDEPVKLDCETLIGSGLTFKEAQKVLDKKVEELTQ